jgi:hypothetical protein
MRAAKLYPFLVIFALLSVLATAQSDTFSVSVNPLNNQIAVNETASFAITIHNGYEWPREFLLDKVGYPFWDMYVSPLANPISYVVPAGEDFTFTLFVKPLHITQIDTYTLDTSISDSVTDRKQVVPLTIGIRSTDALVQGYVPTVLSSIGMPQSVDPREPFTVSINLNNQNVLDYPELTIKLQSKFINEEYLYSLGPKEEKRVEIPIEIDPAAMPQQDTLTVSLMRGERTILTPLTKDYTIQSYLAKEESPQTSSFLKKKKTLTLTSNDPNYQGVVKEETSFFSNLFTSTSPRAAVTEENGVKYLTWEVGMGNSGSMQISITENYRPLVIIVIVIAILLGLYIVFRSPITLSKEIASVGTHEGGISEVKVIVRVKNRGKEPLTDIEVGDVVPHIASVEKELSIGTMQPDKISYHEKKGTIIKWTVSSLEPSEGVILSYRIKSRLSILGDFHLPSATARCKHRNSYVITNSNRVTVHH